MRRSLPTLLTLLVSGAGCSREEAVAPKPASPAPLIVLVHGLTTSPDGVRPVWGVRKEAAGWTGVIGKLEEARLPFGGTIRPLSGKIELPRCLDLKGVAGDPRQARVFALEFSASANRDGQAYKTLELAQALQQLRTLTGASKVRLVTYSAGGLFARMYLQNALPAVPYPGDVERLITLCTPHLGADLANVFGDYISAPFGTVRPKTPLLVQLNEDLDLPKDVDYASIVVRGGVFDVLQFFQDSSEFARLLNRDVLPKLPEALTRGSDQVVDVRSQNLRLGRCANRYEAATGKPIHHLFAQVYGGGFSRLLHDYAPEDAFVQDLVAELVADDARWWSPAACRACPRWQALQAKMFARVELGRLAQEKHFLSSVSNPLLREVRRIDTQPGVWQFRFAGTMDYRPKLAPFDSLAKKHEVEAKLELFHDELGRVVRYELGTFPEKSGS